MKIRTILTTLTTLTNLIIVTILTDQINYQEGICRIRIDYFFLSMLCYFKWKRQ